MSRKIERLINLTIALLATNRFLTKSDIFNSVDGYEGSAETKERMFERDKDDLRTLGIVIDVGSFDPLFGDEAGYRIKSESYQLDLGSITPIEISLLSLAADAWQGAAFAEAAQSALLKLRSIGVAADPIEIPGLAPKLSNSSKDLDTIASGIASSDFLSFDYISSDLRRQPRQVIAFALSNKFGHWYLTGVDQEIHEIRTFRLDRIEGEIRISANKESFEFPQEFDFNSVHETSILEIAVIDVRKGKGHALRALATSSKDLGEWDQIRVPIFNSESLASQVLWHGEDVFVHEPKVLCDRIVAELSGLVSNHE